MKTNSFTAASPAGPHTIAYTEWGEASAPLVICVHGLARNGRDFDRLAEFLASQGRRVICPDIVGRGKSDWLSNPALYGYPQYCADMNAFVASLGVTQLDWVGTSMGGLIGMMLSAQPNTFIRRMVINDIGPFIPKAGLERIASYVGKDPRFPDLAGIEAYYRVTMASFGNLTDSDWHHIAEHSSRQMEDGTFGLAYDPAIALAFKAGPIADVDLWALWDAVKAEVLVLRGANSDILPASVATEMTQRGPKAALVEIQDCGHAPALLDPQQISIVANFLA